VPSLILTSVQELDAREGRELLDRQARRHLCMSAEEFERAEAGELDAEADLNAARVAVLLPFGRPHLPDSRAFLK
jgi:hypothetical protein